MQYSGEMPFFPKSLDLGLVSSLEMEGQFHKLTFSSAERSHEVRTDGIPQI